jgi:hypothetical protein
MGPTRHKLVSPLDPDRLLPAFIAGPGRLRPYDWSYRRRALGIATGRHQKSRSRATELYDEIAEPSYRGRCSFRFDDTVGYHATDFVHPIDMRGHLVRLRM